MKFNSKILFVFISVFIGTVSCKKVKQLLNIVLIMADDMGYECLGCNGSTEYKTPNLDRLALDGIRFEHCYSQPLCTPSRVKIMNQEYKLYRDGSFFNTIADTLEKQPLTALSEKEQNTKLKFQIILDERENEFPFNLNDTTFVINP